jgi:hypothetical protein
MERKWIEFEAGPARPISGLYVTLNHRGFIVFSRGVFEKLNSPEAVKLLFDPATDTIGVQPCNPLMPNAFSPYQKSDSGTRVIHAKVFWKRHNIRLDGTLRVLHAAIEDGILVLPLKPLEVVKKTPRSRKSQRVR